MSEPTAAHAGASAARRTQAADGLDASRTSSATSVAPALASSSTARSGRRPDVTRVPDIEGAISREVLADQIKDRLLEDIVAGRYPPDARIVETRVARELGTSQSPVREALRGLEALGVVEITPFRGSRVRRPTTAELLEAYAIRAELEGLAARLAIPRMADADLCGFARAAEEMNTCAAAGDAHGVARADAAFHRRLIQVARNPTLDRVWHSLEPYSRTYITLIAPNGDPAWTARLHLPILEALRLRDPAAVERALREHFDMAARRLGEGWTGDAAASRAAFPGPR